MGLCAEDKTAKTFENIHKKLWIEEPKRSFIVGSAQVLKNEFSIIRWIGPSGGRIGFLSYPLADTLQSFGWIRVC